MEYELWSMLLKALQFYDASEDHVFCTDGERILCRHEDRINALADCLDDCGYCAVTGYYDPNEDKESGLMDAYTGYYYLEV